MAKDGTARAALWGDSATHSMSWEAIATETAAWDGLSDEALHRFEAELLNGPSMAHDGITCDDIAIQWG